MKGIDKTASIRHSNTDSGIFFEYANYYDIFYQHKNYKKETEFITQLINKHLCSKIKNKKNLCLLDMGCGTGNHILHLLKYGYSLTGLDSSPQMLSAAAKKMPKYFDKNNLICGRMQDFDLHKKFDIIISMFSSIGYIIDKKSILQMLNNVARHMHPESLFIFDFWQKSAVINQYKLTKNKTFLFRGNLLQRASKTQLFPSINVCSVKYECTLRCKGNLVKNFEEEHIVRYFSLIEMQRLLKKSGLKILSSYSFNNINDKIKNDTWNITVVSGKST